MKEIKADISKLIDGKYYAINTSNYEDENGYYYIAKWRSPDKMQYYASKTTTMNNTYCFNNNSNPEFVTSVREATDREIEWLTKVIRDGKVSLPRPKLEEINNSYNIY